MLKMDTEIEGNRGFRGFKTVHDLERRFQAEDMQRLMFEDSEDIIKVGPHDGKPCLGPGCPYCDEYEAM